MAETKEINAKTVMQLRAETSAAMMDCKSALTECGGDLEKAKDWLRKKGKQIADKKSERETKAGTVASYIHLGGKIGVLLELKCETDFVARNEEFQALAKKLAMHIAAAVPVAVSRDKIPADVLEREKAVYRESDQLKGKPANMIDKIIEGKLEAFYKQKCLLDQVFVGADASGDATVKDLVQNATAKMGENVQVARFARFELGEAAG